jgi:fluoride exporter
MRAFLLIGLGGALGANARYLVSTWAANRWGTAFPYGTLIVNVTGSFLLGCVLTVVVVRFGDDLDTRLLIATGFFGAYTTFSTFAFETLALTRQGGYLAATVNVLGTTLLALAGAAAGIALASLTIAATV